MSVKLEKSKRRPPRWASASYAKGCRGPFYVFLSHALVERLPGSGCRLRLARSVATRVRTKHSRMGKWHGSLWKPSGNVVTSEVS